MRLKLLAAALASTVAGPVLAADLPAHSAVPLYAPPPPAFTWTGAYIGLQVGGEWGSTGTSLLSGAPLTSVGGFPNYSQSGVVGGAHLGLLIQSGMFVYGVEADAEGSTFKGSQAVAGALSSVSTREDVETSFRGRLGVAFDRTLVYATGGLAIADFYNTFAGSAGLDSDDHTRFGWTVGGGIAYAITKNLSARVEYRYTDFGNVDDFLANSTGGTVLARVHATDNAVRIGLSYNFSAAPAAAPVLAKY